MNATPVSTLPVIATVEPPALTFIIRRARSSARKPEQIHRMANRCVYNELCGGPAGRNWLLIALTRVLHVGECKRESGDSDGIRTVSEVASGTPSADDRCEGGGSPADKGEA